MLSLEYWRLFFLVGLGGIFGFLNNEVLIGILLGLTIYLLRHLYYIKKLSDWLANAKGKIEPPEGTGIWLSIFERTYQLQKRNRSQKKKLAAALTRFQEAASAMPDAMIILNQEGKIEWFNQATKRLLGFKSPQDIEQYITNLIRYPAFIKFIENTNEKGNEIEIGSPFDESIKLHLNIAPYGKGKALLVARDITKMNRLEEVRRHFVANVSHELRTPLTVLLGYMESLSTNKDARENIWFEPMQQMLNQTNRMQGIVKDLLLLTRLENESKPVIGNDIDVSELIEILGVEAKVLGKNKAQSITLEYDKNLGILGLMEDIQSAFSNLVSNAVRYTPANGDIKIKWFADDHGAHFVVEDSGMGISGVDLPHLTERFFRVDDARSRETGGTGLGLAIVKYALQRHDAVLTITSELDCGSQFSCDFPMDRIVRFEN